LLFLISILSYRLKEKLINNSWPYDVQFINIFILSNLIDSNSWEYEIDLKNIYLIEKPIIYEYSLVIYKNVEYGNCMENTIFQFLKIIFWNIQIENYNYDKIKKITNIPIKFFLNINNEKTKEFELEWVEFITELPIKNNLKFKNYDFIKNNVELNPSLNNLIIFLKYLIKFNDEELLMKTITHVWHKVSKSNMFKRALQRFKLFFFQKSI
jgi:hypothetical protein